MKQRCFFSLMLSGVLLFSAPAGAKTVSEHDPMQRNLVFMDAEAEIHVPVNRVRMVFGFEVEKDSFTNASQAASAIAEKIRLGIEALENVNYRILKGWDLIRQEKISWATKGRKISNRLTVEITDFENARMYDLVAAIIDLSLRADDSVALEDLEVSLTEKAEFDARQKLKTEVLRKLEEKAARSAAALNRSVVAAKRIYMTGDGVPRPFAMAEEAGMAHTAMLRSPVSVQKSFEVNAQVPDSMRLGIHASAVYEIS